MHNSKRSQRHVRLLAVLSIVMMLTSVFPWYQAAGQDATPESDDSVLTTESTQTDSTPPSVTDIAIQCDTIEEHVISATISVANPRADASLDVHVVANGDSGPVVTDPDEGTFTRVPLLDATTSYQIRLPMKPEVAQIGGTVSVMAMLTGGDPTTEFISVTQLPVYASNSATLCGTPPVDAGEEEDPGSTDLPVDSSEEDPGSIASITALPTLTAVSISCTSENSDSVTALVTITDPPTDATTISAQLYANGEPIGTPGTAAIDGATEVPVIISLPASDIGATSLSAKAWLTSDDTVAVPSTADVTVHFSEADGKTLCGVAPTEPDEEAPADEEEPTPTTQYATVVNTSGAQLRCRAAPVNGTTLGMFAAGARVELRGAASNGWYPVVCPNGQDGHASAEYLRAETSSTPTEPAPGATSGVAVVHGTDGAGLRCRTAPVSGAIIGVYADGTRLPMRGSVENGWAPVTCDGRAGWVSTQYARVETGGGTTSPTPTPAPGTGTGKYGTVVNTGGQGLRCRTAPVSGAIILVAPEGTKLETRGAAVNNWYPVVCNGQAGHVSGDYFTLSTDGGTTTPPVSGGSSTAMVSGTGGGGLRCRTQPVDGATITVMPEGSLVDVRGSVVNGWAPVKCAGQNGWSSAAYLNFNVSGGATGTLWMDVDLGDQYMRVYRGNSVIAQTYVSTGRPGFTTPTGNFYINHKLRSQTMSGVLGGEYYYVPNVPWVMYFTNVGHAIHGAYWHNNFGQVMSHGCINLPVGFAEWLYSVTPYGSLVRIHW